MIAVKCFLNLDEGRRVTLELDVHADLPSYLSGGEQARTTYCAD